MPGRGSDPRPPCTPARAALEACWLDLTGRLLPALAAECRWPVRADHCFQRILLDNACEGRWYDAIAGRPAYAFAGDDVLARAVALGEQAIAGCADMARLNARSLRWRGKRGDVSAFTSVSAHR